MFLTKRTFIKACIAATSIFILGENTMASNATLKNAAGATGNSIANQPKAPFTLPDLPYASTALEPYMTSNTFSFHHGKHHQAYVTNLNNLVKDTPLAANSLEEIILATASDPSKAAIFNNAAQVWNHTFFWHSMKPNGGGAPVGTLLAKINADFGSVEKFQEEFKAAGIAQFGSGWAWLVLEDGKLKVTRTANGDLPMAHGQIALLTADVWEHAYYLDYQNRRPDYLTTFLEKLVNWEFAAQNFAAAY
jgi:superoxide dismutase, Fe-Mn family